MSTTRYDAMRLDYVVWHRLCRFYFEIYVLLSCIDDLSISVFYTNTIIILLHAYIYIYIMKMRQRIKDIIFWSTAPATRTDSQAR